MKASTSKGLPAMTVRDASFGDLFKIGFWIQLAPALVGFAMIGATLTVLFLFMPEAPRILVQGGVVPGVSPDTPVNGPLAAIAVVWVGVALYALFSAGLAALRALSGAVLLTGWRRMMEKRRARRAASASVQAAMAVPAE